VRARLDAALRDAAEGDVHLSDMKPAVSFDVTYAFGQCRRRVIGKQFFGERKSLRFSFIRVTHKSLVLLPMTPMTITRGQSICHMPTSLRFGRRIPVGQRMIPL
jgi:hypothetical protein